jgi:hypothetical protein
MGDVPIFQHVQQKPNIPLVHSNKVGDSQQHLPVHAKVQQNRGRSHPWYLEDFFQIGGIMQVKSLAQYVRKRGERN